MSRPRSKVVAVRVTGPVAPYAQQLRAVLAERGFTPLSRVNQLQVMQHLSKWMQVGGLDITDLTSERVDEYVAHRRDDGYACYCTRSSIVQLLDVLAACGAPLAGPAPAPPGSGDLQLIH